MKERHIKVYESPGQKRDVPRINLQGDWLAKLGYQVGDKLKVSYEDGRIIVEHDPAFSSPATS